MDAGGRPKTPGSETKESLLLTETAVARVSAFSCAGSEPQFAQDDVKRARWYLLTQWVMLQKRNPEIRESETFIMGTCLLLWRETLYLLSLFIMQISLKK